MLCGHLHIDTRPVERTVIHMAWLSLLPRDDLVPSLTSSNTVLSLFSSNRLSPLASDNNNSLLSNSKRSVPRASSDKGVSRGRGDTTYYLSVVTTA